MAHISYRSQETLHDYISWRDDTSVWMCVVVVAADPYEGRKTHTVASKDDKLIELRSSAHM